MVYFLCTLKGLLCTILLTHNTEVSGEAEDLTPIVVFVQQFVKPYVSFVRRWVKPNQDSFGNKTLHTPPFKLQTVVNNTVVTVLGVPSKKRAQEFLPRRPSWMQKKLLSFENRTLMPMSPILRMKSTSHEDIFKKAAPADNNEWRDTYEIDPFSEKEIASFINEKVKGYVNNDDFENSVSREKGPINARTMLEKALNLNIARLPAFVNPKLNKNVSNSQSINGKKQVWPKVAMRPTVEDKKVKSRVFEGFHDFKNIARLMSNAEPKKLLEEEIVLPDLKFPNNHGDDSQDIVFENGDIHVKRSWNDDERKMATVPKSTTANACIYDGRSTRVEIDLGLNKNEKERSDLFKAICPYIYDDKSNPFKSVVNVLNRPTLAPTLSHNNDGLDLVAYINRHRGVTPKNEELFREVVDIED